MASGCGGWVTQDGKPAAPNCVYLTRAEQRFGNGDGVFTLAEQRRPRRRSTTRAAASQLHCSPRRLRLGLELNFYRIHGGRARRLAPLPPPRRHIH